MALKIKKDNKLIFQNGCEVERTCAFTIYTAFSMFSLQLKIWKCIAALGNRLNTFGQDLCQGLALTCVPFYGAQHSHKIASPLFGQEF